MSTSNTAAETTTSSWTSWSSPLVPSDNMDLEWFFKEFLLQCAVNLFCVLVILLAIWIYIEFWMKPPHPHPSQSPEPAKYEEELEKIKLDLATISTTYLLTKNMRSKWKSQATEGEEVEEKEEESEEIREEEADKLKQEIIGGDKVVADKKK